MKYHFLVLFLVLIHQASEIRAGIFERQSRSFSKFFDRPNPQEIFLQNEQQNGFFKPQPSDEKQELEAVVDKVI